jgi:hypothetical protein
MHAFLSQQGIELIAPRTSGHGVVVERLISTIKRLIVRWCWQNEKSDFIPVLQQLINVYNSRVHRYRHMAK